MALDRKIRIGLQVSELLADPSYEGEDVEVRQKMGREQLKKYFGMLMRGRDRPNGILGEGEELSASDTLVKAAECALKNDLLDIAKQAVRSFLLQSPPRNQFFCRALFVQAQLQQRETLDAQCAGDDLVRGLLKAVGFILTVVDIAMDPTNRPRYNFLVYNASVHYWNVVRPLLRPGVQQFLVESFSKVVSSLNEIEDEDTEWRTRLLLTLARCCDDAGRFSDALSHASGALDLQEAAVGNSGANASEDGTTSTLSPLMSEVRRCVIHMARSGAGDASKQLDRVKTAKCLSQGASLRAAGEFGLQCIKSGLTKPEIIGEELTRILGVLTGSDDSESPEDAAVRNRTFISDLLVDGGLIAASNQLDAVAQQYLNAFDSQRGSAGEQNIRADFLRCQLMSRSLPDTHDGSGGASKKEGGASRRGGRKGGRKSGRSQENVFNPLKIDKRRLQAMRVSRQVEAVKLLERALNAAKRSDDIDILHEGCVLTWNLGLPLLQPHLRRHIHRAFNIAAGALEDVDSQSLKELRAKIHFEIAKTEVASDFLQKATSHVNKALALDYGSVSQALANDPTLFGAVSGDKKAGGKKSEAKEDAGSDDPDLLRPLDRFLVPLQKTLGLKSSIYKEPDTLFEKVTIMVEQAKDANDPHLKGTLLKRVIGMLADDSAKKEEAKQHAQAARAEEHRQACIKAEEEAEVTGEEPVFPPPPLTEEEEEEAKSPEEKMRNLRNESQETTLWTEILKMTWELKMLPLVQQASQVVLKRKDWDPATFKEIVLLQVEANFIRGHAFVELVRSAPIRWWHGVQGVDGLHPKALGLLAAEGSSNAGEKIIGMKRNVIASFVDGCALALALKEPQLVENAAVYLWNFHLHIFRDNGGRSLPKEDRLKRMLPELVPAFETVLGALHEVGCKDVELICKICEGLALSYEYSKSSAKVDEYCKIGIDACSDAGGKPLYARPLVYISARSRRTSNGKGSAGDGDAVRECMATVKVLTLPDEQVAATEKKSTLTAVMEKLNGIRDRLLFDVSSPEAIAAAKEASAAVSAPPAGSSENTEAVLVEKTLEDVHAGMEIWTELWAKLAQCAIEVGNTKAAQVCGSKAAEAIPSSIDDQRNIPKAIWRWHALAECVWGNAIYLLIDPTRQERALQDDLRDTSMLHLTTSARWATRAAMPRMVLVAAKLLWNVGLRSMGSKLTRKALRNPVQKCLRFLAEVGEQSDLAFRVQLYQLLLKCCEDAEEWQAGLLAVKEAFQYIPKSLQRPLWSSRVKFLSKLGKNVAEGINKMKESDVAMQARAWLTLADSSTEETDIMSAFLSAIDTTNGTFHAIECYLSFANFLFVQGYSRNDIVLYATRAMDSLLCIDPHDNQLAQLSMAPHADDMQVGIGNGAAAATGNASVADSRVSRGTKQSMRSSRGGMGSKQSGSSRSLISATTASLATDGRGKEEDMPSLKIHHFNQLIEGALLLSQAASRFDEREDALLLAQNYVVRIWHDSYSAVENKIALEAYNELPEFTEKGEPQPAFSDWVAGYWKNREGGKPFVEPTCDADWLRFWPSDDLLSAFKEASSGDESLTLMDMSSWPTLEQTCVHLDVLASSLVDRGFEVASIPVFVLWDVLATHVMKPIMPAMQRCVRYRLAHVFSSINLPENAANMRRMAGPLVPSKAELELYDEEIVQLEQMQSSSLEDDTKKDTHEEAGKVYQRELDRLQVHDMWIQLAKQAIHIEGSIGDGLSLLIEAKRHAEAFEDKHALANIAELNSQVSIMKGDANAAISDISDALGTADIQSVHTGTKRLLRRVIIMTGRTSGAGDIKPDVHGAKKLLGAYLTKLKEFSQLCMSRSLERGSKSHQGYAGDLDVKISIAQCELELAMILCDEAVALRVRESPNWESEWQKCSKMFENTLRMMESVCDKKQISSACRHWAEAILSIVSAATVDDSDLESRLEQERRQAMLLYERAEFHAINRVAQCQPTISGRLATKEMKLLSLPAERDLANLQIAIGSNLLQAAQLKYLTASLRRRKQRNQQRRMGSASAEDNVVQQWLDRTAKPPELSNSDCEVQPTGSAMLRFSSAHATCSRVPEMSSKTQIYVGLAALQTAREQEQCIGVWPDATAVDKEEEQLFALEQRRMQGTGYLEQAKLNLREGLAMALKLRQWTEAGLAAKGLADSMGVYNNVEAAKMICLWQSCVARTEMYRIYCMASRSTAPEAAFVRKASIDNIDITKDESQNHYLSESSMAWRRMDCSSDMDEIISMLPRSMPLLILQATEDYSCIYVAALRNSGETSSTTREDGEDTVKPVVDAAVHRHVMDPSAISNLKAAMERMTSWRKHLKLTISQSSSSPSFDHQSQTSEPDPANHELDSEIVESMSEVLDPALASPEIMAVLNNPKKYPAGESTHAVLCLDYRLQKLPVEMCPTIQRWRLSSKLRNKMRKHLDDEEAEAAAARAETEYQDLCKTIARPSLSRDFSLHVLGDRLRCSGGERGVQLESPNVNLSKLRFIVDPRYEDKLDESAEQSSDIDVSDPESEYIATATETFEAIRSSMGGDGNGWQGIKGADLIPSWAEWQRTLADAASDTSCFLSYGLGPCLAHFPPERAASLSLKGLRLALLVGKSVTEGSLRRLAKMANKKTNSQLQLEEQVETAMIMTLMGIDSVVVNSWASSLTSNRRLALGIFKHLSQGKTVSESVDCAVARVGEPDDSTTKTPANSRPSSKKAGKKAKKGKGGGKATPPPEVTSKDKGEEKTRLKTRVKMNPTVFGLPHLKKV